MRIVGITELMCLPGLSPPRPHPFIMPFSICRCHSPKPLKRPSLRLLFFFLSFPSSLPLLKRRVALCCLFILCCLQLVPRLVTLKHHSPYRSLKSLLIFPASVTTLCPSDCVQGQECLYLPLLLFVVCRHDRSTPRVPAGRRCDTVSPFFLVLISASDVPLLLSLTSLNICC